MKEFETLNFYVVFIFDIFKGIFSFLKTKMASLVTNKSDRETNIMKINLLSNMLNARESFYYLEL